jgi:hypothetical protein
MNFKTGLIMRKNSQASIEYIILMVFLMGLLTVWLAQSFPALRDNLETKFFNKAVEKILEEPVGTPPQPPPPPRPPPPPV